MLLTYIISILVEVLLPIGLGAWVIVRYRSRWRIFLVGILCFIGAQVLHIPFLQLVTNLFRNGTLTPPPAQYQLAFNAVFLGLAAGIFEETARWIGYRVLRSARSWGDGVTLGLGHGGIESIAVGVSVLAALITSGGPQALGGTWDLPLAGAVERIGAICMHVALSLLVLESFRRRNALYFIGAILWHALADAAILPLQAAGWTVWQMEGAFMGLAVINLGIIYYFYKRQGGAVDRTYGPGCCTRARGIVQAAPGIHP